MEIKHLDLCEARCPLALLLVKRAVVSLTSNQQLLVDVSDVGAQKDIPHYLNSRGCKVLIQEFKTMTRFVVTQ